MNAEHAMTIERPSHRIPSLDGIRALAIFSVIYSHITLRIKSFLFFPYDGVGLFFVLSGFLITMLLLREKEKTGNISLYRFYVRRFFRIVPPLYAYIVFAVLCLISMHAHFSWKEFIGPVLFISNLDLLKTHPVIEHAWSLGVEEQFYILWPILMIGCLKLRGKKAAILATFAMFILAPISRLLVHFFVSEGHGSHLIFTLLFCRMDSLGIGCAIALLIGTPKFEALYTRIEKFWWVAPVVFMLLSPLADKHLHSLYENSIQGSIDSVCMGFFILWASRNADSVVGRFLNNPLMVKIGVLSYSLYLYQTFFLHLHTGVVVLNSFPLNVVLIPLAALASFYLIEQPSLHARDWFLRVSSLRKKVDLDSSSVAQEAHANPSQVTTPHR
jgi:peptidoglycan/LPS O-acetylase OafA/YrhL